MTKVLQTHVPKIKIANLRVGEIAAVMIDNQAVGGPLKGWTVYSPFEIPADMYLAMLGEIPTRGELIRNNTARIISLVEDIDGYVSGALVIWQNDTQYFCAMLFSPDVDRL